MPFPQIYCNKEEYYKSYDKEMAVLYMNLSDENVDYYFSLMEDLEKRTQLPLSVWSYGEDFDE